MPRVSPLRRVLRLVVGAAVAFLLVTWLALEGGDVGVLRTHEGGPTWRDTRVWYVEDGTGSLWIEAATSDRPWLIDVRSDDEVTLVRDDVPTRWRAQPVEDPAAHDRVRSLLREKYGWADRWVGLIQDTSHSIAVRLDPR